MSSLLSSSSSSSPLRRSVSLRISQIEEYIEGVTQGYRVSVTVVEAIGLPQEIFVFQQLTVAQGTTPNDEFSNVASPSDIEEYPAGVPSSDSLFFRLNTVDLVYRSLDLLEENLQDLKRDICQLLETLNQMDDLTSEIIIIDDSCAIGGTDPCPPRPRVDARVIGDYRDPTADDDAEAGYGIGSIWTNVVSQTTYVLISNTNGEAIWVTLTGTATKHNFTADRDPTVDDDITEEYIPGSHWYNTVDDSLFICVSNTEGAAVWRRISPDVKHNFTATTDPGLDDDSTEGYAPASEWYNTTTGNLFICVDSSEGAALWARTTGGGAGLGLYETPDKKLNIQVDNDSTSVTADNDLVAATLTKIDAEINAIVTSGDDSDSGIRITLKPAGRGFGDDGDRAVLVFINGQKVIVGDGDGTKDCFFSDSASAPYAPKYLADIEPGDKLIWNGAIAGYDLDADDVVSLHYTTLQLAGSSSSGNPGEIGIWGIGVWGEFVWGQA